MDAWETLLDNSTLASGDAWEHLNAQEGGGGGTDQIIYVTGGLEGAMEDTVLTATMHEADLQAALADPGELSGTIQEVSLVGSMQDATLTGTITEAELTGAIECLS